MRLGDFWWYTGLQFAVSRCGDLINAFIGLWLVPKYVGVAELGAVLPLTSFAVVLSLPITAFSTAFAKQVNVLSLHGEWGKLKTLLRSVFLWVAGFVVLAIVVVKFGMPWVLERVRIDKGSLGVVIIVSALLTTVSPIYVNTLQSMKRFATVSVINLCCAPIRLIVMLVTMPIRAITGYFVGQSAGPAFQIVCSSFVLRREMGAAVKAEPYWTKEMVKWFFRYTLLIMLSQITGALVGFVDPLVIRQRLPEADSAAYYMISRFAEIGSYLGFTLTTVIFPYVSEATEKGSGGQRYVIVSMIGSVLFGVVCAIVLGLFGRLLLTYLPGGEIYGDYISELVCLTLIMALGVAFACFVMSETAANRFGWISWFIPIHLLYAGTLLVLTGPGYLMGKVPSCVFLVIKSWNACSLDFVLGMMGGFSVIKIVCALIYMKRMRFPGEEN